MSKMTITPEQLEALPGLHHAVAVTLIKTGKWRLTGGDPEVPPVQPKLTLP
jgi:hypothetical protein